MSRFHSRQMLANGSAWDIPVAYDIEGLYRDHQLYHMCQFAKEGGEALLTPEDGKFLAVQRIDVSSGDESRIAADVMKNWAESSYHADKFGYKNANTAGVGLVIDAETATAYVTMSVC